MRRRSVSALALQVLVPALLGVVGCSAGNDKSGGTLLTDAGPGGGGDDSGTGFNPGGDDGGLQGVDVVTPEGGGTTGGGCVSADDCDGDGYTAAQGDCDDHDKTINPEAYDFPGDNVDNDCDGTKDNPVPNCTGSGSQTAALDYARTLDLCPQRATTKTGRPFDPIVSAQWANVGGMQASPKQIGRKATFGDNAARNGADLVGMSTGVLGDPDPRGSANSAIYGGLFPPQIADPCSTLPLNATDCASVNNGTGGTATANDYAELKLTVKVPSNANGMSFDFSFFSSEFNEFWNSQFNDTFFALVTTQQIKGANVAKDAKGRAITVNSGYFQLCPAPPGPSGLDPAKTGGLVNCVGQPTDPTKKILGSLHGTGFAGDLLSPPSSNDTTPGTVDPSKTYVYGGGSGWLTSQFGVTPGEQMVIRFIIFDAGDEVLDSAVILDNVTWQKAPPAVVTGSVDRPPS